MSPVEAQPPAEPRPSKRRQGDTSSIPRRERTGAAFPAPPAPGQVVAGRYRLSRELARGGMGSVWIARHLRLDVDVAIKFMQAGSPPSGTARRRFEREARISALLRSPYVVAVTDYGADGDVPFLVMELLEGESLAARLKREGRLGMPAVAALLAQIARSLSRVHEAGVVHRDLKPANLFLARYGEEEVVKILDFGIAKALEPDGTALTLPGEVVGSPRYMSPEQIRWSGLADPRSDLWAAGVILFQALTGTVPFSGNLVQLYIKIAASAEPIPRPSSLVPGLGPEVDLFFDRALARDMEQRFQTVQELTAAFDRLLPRPAAALLAAAQPEPPERWSRTYRMLPVVRTPATPAIEPRIEVSPLPPPPPGAPVTTLRLPPAEGRLDDHKEESPCVTTSQIAAPKGDRRTAAARLGRRAACLAAVLALAALARSPLRPFQRAAASPSYAPAGAATPFPSLPGAPDIPPASSRGSPASLPAPVAAVASAPAPTARSAQGHAKSAWQRGATAAPRPAPAAKPATTPPEPGTSAAGSGRRRPPESRD